jgi:hypothetical protein
MISRDFFSVANNLGDSVAFNLESDTGRRLSDTEDIIANTDADFMDRLWLLGITLVFIMASGENLLERGVQLKSVKPKNQADQPVEYWSPNYLGRVYQAETEGLKPD